MALLEELLATASVIAQQRLRQAQRRLHLRHRLRPVLALLLVGVGDGSRLELRFLQLAERTLSLAGKPKWNVAPENSTERPRPPSHEVIRHCRLSEWPLLHESMPVPLRLSQRGWKKKPSCGICLRSTQILSRDSSA